MRSLAASKQPLNLMTIEAVWRLVRAHTYGPVEAARSKCTYLCTTSQKTEYVHIPPTMNQRPLFKGTEIWEVTDVFKNMNTKLLHATDLYR